MGIQSMKVGFDLNGIVVLEVPVTCNVNKYRTTSNCKQHLHACICTVIIMLPLMHISTVEPLYTGHHWDLYSRLSCIQRCRLFRGRFVHSCLWLEQQTVSSLERCLVFSVLCREVLLYLV